jgi:murein DD-endopeptidase MepM/ murein hydrolase activator NlpD
MGRLKPGRALAAVLGVVAAVGCATPPRGGVVHVVRPGENLYRISKHYGVSVDRLVRANRIRDVRDLGVGQRLVVPGSTAPRPSASLAPDVAAAAVGGPTVPFRSADLALQWPVRGRVSSGYGGRRGGLHEGIDIPARRGTPIHAAEAGRVIHSSRKLGDYGRVIIIKHTGGYSTVYAHNDRNDVKKGQFVEKGQVIGRVGETGNASGPHLHFEVRHDRVARNPLLYLP